MRPKRRFTIEINAGADTREGLVRQLREAVDLIADGIDSCLCGACEGGYRYRMSEDPQMTRDRYFELLALEAVE